MGDTEKTLRQVCEFIDLPFEQTMTDPYARAEIEKGLGPVGGWREKLDPSAVQAFEEVGGDLLDELGYRQPVQVAG